MAEESKELTRPAPRELSKPGFAFLPKTWEELYGYAKEIANTDFVPKALQGKPGAVLAAWQTGQEVGLPPMAALQSIAIINGRPSIHSAGFWALITSHPLCEWFKETPPDEALKQGYGECTIKRRGNPHEITRRFSMEEAKTAGLLGKDNWKNYPGDMLQNRARHRAGDDAIPEALQGLLPSDIARDIPPEPRDVTPQPIATPQPLENKANEPKRRVHDAQTDGGDPRPDGDRPSAMDGESTNKTVKAPRGDKSKDASALPEHEATDPKPSKEDLAILKIDSYEKETWPEGSVLNDLIRGLDQDAQIRVCKHWSARQKEVNV
jgi:hypothetical protein